MQGPVFRGSFYAFVLVYWLWVYMGTPYLLRFTRLRGVLRNTVVSQRLRGDLSPKTAKRLATAQGRRGPKGCRLLRARALSPHLRSGIGVIARARVVRSPLGLGARHAR